MLKMIATMMLPRSLKGTKLDVSRPSASTMLKENLATYPSVSLEFGLEPLPCAFRRSRCGDHFRSPGKYCSEEFLVAVR